MLFGETKGTYLQENLDRAAEAADNGNVDEVYRLLKPWVKPRYKAPPLRQAGQWSVGENDAAEQRRRQYKATFKGQVVTCAELAAGTEKRAEDREPCLGIVPPTVDEVLDLILSASRGTAPGVVGSPRRGFCLQRALPIMWKGSIMATIPSEKNKTSGVMLNDHVGKILGRWIRPLLQIEPFLVARSQAIGSSWSSHDTVCHARVF